MKTTEKELQEAKQRVAELEAELKDYKDEVVAGYVQRILNHRCKR